MPAIIFNYNFCDLAPECGGIEACPQKAIYFDKKTNMPCWDKTKCVFCLRCTLPNVCPIGAILYARDDESEKQTRQMVKIDPKKREWLWQERYGVQPGMTPPLVTKITPANFETIIQNQKNKIIDVWHVDSSDCRLHSPLYSDLLDTKAGVIEIYKLDAREYPELATKLKVSIFPSLLLFKENNEVARIEEFLNSEELLQHAKTTIDQYLKA